MGKPAANIVNGRSGWQWLTSRAESGLSRLGRGALALIWIWLALKAAVGDDGGQSDALMDGMLLIAGLVCLVGLLVLQDEGGARDLQPAYSYHARAVYHHGAGHLRRRYECRIIADSRRNGVPQIVLPPPQQGPRVVMAGEGGVSVRAAKIKKPRRKAVATAAAFAGSAGESRA